MLAWELFQIIRIQLQERNFVAELLSHIASKLSHIASKLRVL